MSVSEFANIYASINNLQNQYDAITGNIFSNYNQITQFSSQQSTLYNSIYYGIGNINSGNINFTGNISQNNQILSESPWTASGNNIYYNSGNIGIGTINPQNKLDIVGNTNMNGTLMMSRLQSTLYGTVNYNIFGTAGGSVQNITVPGRGLYFFSCGANYNDINTTTTLMLTTVPGQLGRVTTIFNPGFGVTLGNITSGFSISGLYPVGFITFEIRYIYFAF